MEAKWDRHQSPLRIDEQNGDKYYPSVLMCAPGDPPCRYSVGDVVTLDMGDDLPESVAEVCSLWEDGRDGTMWLECRWYFTPEEALERMGKGRGKGKNKGKASKRNGAPDFNWEHELLESDLVDENLLECVLGKATILSYDEWFKKRGVSFCCRDHVTWHKEERSDPHNSRDTPGRVPASISAGQGRRRGRRKRNVLLPFCLQHEDEDAATTQRRSRRPRCEKLQQAQ